MEKKAQSQKILFIVLAALIGVLIVLFAIMSIQNIRKEKMDLEANIFEEDLKEEVEQNIRMGTKKSESVTAPSGADFICFADLEKTDLILNDPEIDTYPVIKDSIQSGLDLNMFIISNEEVIDSTYVGRICFDEEPYLFCVETATPQLDMIFEGRGKCTKLSGHDINRGREYGISGGEGGGGDGGTGGSCGSCESGETCDNGVCVPEQNNIPVILSIAITSPAYVNGTISCSAFAEDDDEDAVTINYAWSSNGTSELSGFTDSLLNLSEVDDEEAGDLITCTATPSDGIDNGNSWSANVSLRLSVENATYVDIISPIKGSIYNLSDAILFNATAIDIEEGDLSGSISWNSSIDGNLGTGNLFSLSDLSYGIHIITASVTDSDGDVGSDIVTISIEIPPDMNVKNSSKYEDGQLFLVSVEEDWRVIDSLIPIVIWNDDGITINYTHIAYYNSTGFGDDNISDIMADNNANDAVIFDPPDAITETNNITIDSYTNDYFSYWNNYYDIVVVDYDNEDMALISSLYAAYLNAPIIFADSINIANYDIDSKSVHVIENIDTTTNSTIQSSAANVTYYNESQLRDTGINPFADLLSEITIR